MGKIRNIAIIAHVDHGKTTLVDNIIYASHLFEERQEKKDLIMDNNELEKERGITILSKNVSVHYKGVKINIIDTPGHADFGGEVERVLRMADGVLLIVDAFEGVMPQTRFVLKKAITLGLTPIVVINKLDKKNCRPQEVHEEVFDLMFDLGATEEQLDFSTLYGSSKQAWMSTAPSQKTENIIPLLDTILEKIPSPPQKEGIAQFQITSSDHSDFKGRIAIGRMYQGYLHQGDTMSLCKADGSTEKVTIKELHVFEGLSKKKVDSIGPGEICTITGIENFEIGDTISHATNPAPLSRIKVDEPTMSMLFTINNSPLAGKEGKFVTSRHLRDRLFKEAEKNLALRIKTTNSKDKFLVFGRGILHLSILIETMRREGYELQVGQAQMIFKEIDGIKCEPIEKLIIDVTETYAGKVIELVTQKKGTLLIMEPRGDQQHLEFEIPARGLIGLRNNLLTITTGQAIINHRFKQYEPHKGHISERINGSMVAMETGTSTAYAMSKLKDRGSFFINPGTSVYAGQVIGKHNRANDIVVNVLKGKKLTNMRASGSDDSIKIPQPKLFSLEEAMEYIQKDEYVELTPQSLRIRKIYLDEKDRKRYS